MSILFPIAIVFIGLPLLAVAFFGISAAWGEGIVWTMRKCGLNV